MKYFVIAPFNNVKGAARSFSNLTFTRLLLLFLFLTVHFAGAQGIDARDWPMPAGHRNGLVRPGFRIAPRFEFSKIGDIKKLVLKMDIKLASPMDPVAPYSYRYMKDGKIYTDQQLGKDVFHPIYLKVANFEVRVQGEGKAYTVLYQSVIGHQEIAIVNKDTRTDSYAAFIIELKSVYYGGTEQIEQAIRNYEAAAKEKAAQAQSHGTRANSSSSLASQPAGGNTSAQSSSSNTTRQSANKATSTRSSSTDSFREDKPQAKSSGAATNNSSNQHIPDLVRSKDGGYYQRGADGQFREITADEYARAKQAQKTVQQATTTKTQPAGPTLEEVQANIRNSIAQEQARQEAFNQKIEQWSQAMEQNFYYAEAISSGKQNLAELSRLSGNYNSVAELEAEFNQKAASIQAEVSNIQEARNGKLSNAVNSSFNQNATDQAIAQGVEQIGSIVNHHKAQKEAREAHQALWRERQEKLAAMEAARKQAILDLRNKLVTSFPDGGTPISSHKVNTPEVYLFAYTANRGSFANEQASIAVSNVFPVSRYSDGTYPYKTTVVNKLKGFVVGDVTLVGYYTDRQKAEEMRAAFLNLAQKSSLGIQNITYQPAKTAASKEKSDGDFWETGTKAAPVQKKKGKEDDFWNN